MHRASQWSKTLLYVDSGVIVLNKPPGLVSQPMSGEDDFTKLLLDFRERFRLQKHAPYPVHRLDKGTTGCLVLARSDTIARELSRQFHARTVEKTYLALVRGGEEFFRSKSGEIRQPIMYRDGRASLASTKNRDESHAESATDWELVGSSPHMPLSLLRLKLLTGRKHQLRVHTSYCLNAPILGDELYSQTVIAKTISNKIQIPNDRLYLHSSSISFLKYKRAGPQKCFRLKIVAPLPSDFRQICYQARIQVQQTETDGALFADDSLIHDGQIPAVGGYWVKDTSECHSTIN